MGKPEHCCVLSSSVFACIGDLGFRDSGFFRCRAVAGMWGGSETLNPLLKDLSLSDSSGS